MTENEAAMQIVGVAYKLHTSLGPGLLESVYEAVMAYELEKRGLKALRQYPLPVRYETVQLDVGFHADLLKDNIIRIANGL